jgi:two-component system chemotaxis response regulator CheB
MNTLHKASQAVSIGASTGGINALKTILKEIPGNFPGAILIVQHRKASAEDLFSNLLRQVSQLPVQEVADKTLIYSSYVYVAPANYHMLVERDRRLSLSIDEPVSYARPSIDVLFESAAEVYHSCLVGVLLTGANHDGTAGMRKIKACGGINIAQDPATAEAKVMPKTAIDAGVINHVLPLTEIASFIVNYFEKEFVCNGT